MAVFLVAPANVSGVVCWTGWRILGPFRGRLVGFINSCGLYRMSEGFWGIGATGDGVGAGGGGLLLFMGGVTGLNKLGD